jgi:hypothetical protein
MKSASLFLLCGLCLWPALAPAAGQVGELAPDFSLTNTQGETVDIVFGQGEVYLMAFVGFS